MEILEFILFELVPALIDVLGDLAISGVLDRRQRRRGTAPPPPEAPKGWRGLAGAGVLGALTGAASAWLCPRPLFPDPVIPWASVVVAPIVTGFVGYAWGRVRRRRGHRTTTLATFWGGAVFAATCAIVRRLLVT